MISGSTYFTYFVGYPHLPVKSLQVRGRWEGCVSRWVLEKSEQQIAPCEISQTCCLEYYSVVVHRAVFVQPLTREGSVILIQLSTPLSKQMGRKFSMIPSPSLGPSLLTNRASQDFFRPPFKRERPGEGAPSLGRSLLATRAEKSLTGPASA